MSPPPILNPQAVPVHGTDDHLPGVDASRLTSSALRLSFARPADWVPEHAGDGRVLSPREATRAAVLVALVERASGLQVLLTRRTEHLRDHAGQISFPGGRAEPDDSGPAATAMREASEEVGLAADQVQVIGQMPVYTTVTHFVVTPVVALVRPPLALRLDRFEVAEAFEVPLHYLMNPANHRRHLFAAPDGQRQFLSIPWHGPGADGVEREYFIWGATAAMLRNLYRFLSA